MKLTEHNDTDKDSSYFRFLVNCSGKNRLKGTIKKSLATNNKEQLFDKNVLGIYEQAFENEEFDQLALALENTNHSIYHLEKLGSEATIEAILKNVDNYAEKLLKHELKMRLLLNDIPTDWCYGLTAEELFKELFQIQFAASEIEIEQTQKVGKINKTGFSPMFAKHETNQNAYLFCIPFKGFQDKWYDIANCYENAVQIPPIFRAPFIIKSSKIQYDTPNEVRNYINGHCQLLLALIEDYVNDEMADSIDAHGKKLAKQYLQELLKKGEKGIIDCFAINYHSSIIDL